jgi:hypothetical protein
MQIVLTFDSQSACGPVRGYRNKNNSRSYFEIIKNRYLQIQIISEVSFFRKCAYFPNIERCTYFLYIICDEPKKILQFKYQVLFAQRKIQSLLFSALPFLDSHSCLQIVAQQRREKESESELWVAEQLSADRKPPSPAKELCAGGVCAGGY